jgi:hypothetical protein
LAAAQDSIQNLRQYSLTEEELVRGYYVRLWAQAAFQRKGSFRDVARVGLFVCARRAPQEARRALHRSRNLLVISPPPGAPRGRGSPGADAAPRARPTHARTQLSRPF